jgi:hypothetical protein
MWDTFSRRQKRLSGEFTDVFTYDEIPSPLRVQICNIWKECFGYPSVVRVVDRVENPAYIELHQGMANELGMVSFPANVDHVTAIFDFFLNRANTEQALDMIDMSLQYALHVHNDRGWRDMYYVKILPFEAIEQLNARFLQHGVGYSFISGTSPQLIRKDNEHLHQEAVLPALHLLHEQGFAGADAEYREAHEHYRHGRYKECLVECNKAFESTMKTICSKKKWGCKETDTASALINTCLENGLLPSFMKSHLGAIPTVRNKLGGHGQGEQPKEVQQFFAEYLLHETAVTIVLLVEAYKDLK